MDKREGKYQDFHQKFLVSQCRKRPYGNPLVFQHFQVSKKFMLQMVCQDFPSKVFCLTVPKNFVGEPLSPSLMSGIEKNYASEGYVTIFRRKFIVSQYRNIL